MRPPAPRPTGAPPAAAMPGGPSSSHHSSSYRREAAGLQPVPLPLEGVREHDPERVGERQRSNRLLAADAVSNLHLEPEIALAPRRQRDAQLVGLPRGELYVVA